MHMQVKQLYRQTELPLLSVVRVCASSRHGVYIGLLDRAYRDRLGEAECVLGLHIGATELPCSISFATAWRSSRSSFDCVLAQALM